MHGVWRTGVSLQIGPQRCFTGLRVSCFTISSGLVFRVSEFGRGCEGPCFVFRVSDFPRLFRACGALGLWRRLRRALTSQGRKPPTRCVDFAYEGRTDVTFGGNWYCQDPICMSDRLHAWAKLVCTCKQLSRLLIARYPVCSTVSEPAR